MVDPEQPDDTPWYANRGIPLGIIIYLIIATIAGTAWLTNIADRVTFIETAAPPHSEIASRLAVIETQVKEIRAHQKNSQ